MNTRDPSGPRAGSVPRSQKRLHAFARYGLHPDPDGTFLHRRLVTTLCPGGQDRLRRMMDLVRYGRVDLRPLFTHQMKLGDVPRGYDLFRQRRDGVIKIAIRG